jgi:hypothetical protein
MGATNKLATGEGSHEKWWLDGTFCDEAKPMP